MNKMMIAGALMLAMSASAQNNPKLEAVGSSVKATYYYDNGKISQQGMFTNGKPDGKWVAYNEDGTKRSEGAYAEGSKTGKWFFWNAGTLSEVDYRDSRVADVKTWKQDAPLVHTP